MSKKSTQDKIAALKNIDSLNPFPKKVRDPSFLEADFFDPRDIVQVRYELIRRVQSEGISVTQATKNFGISRLSYYRILYKFEKYGLQGLIPKKRGPKTAHKLNVEIVDFMNKKKKENPSIKSDDLKKMIKKEFKLTVHVRTIERALKKEKKTSWMNR